MALTTTTLSAACAVDDTQISVTSATGFAANSLVQVGQEFMQVYSNYVSGTILQVRRGLNSTFPYAHPSGTNATAGTPTDFAGPSATVVTAYPLSGLRRKRLEYSASGAITLPTSGEDMIAVLNGTSALAMTIAVPTKDIDGSFLWIVSNGAAAHTITFTGGLSGAGTSYDVITVNATAPIAVHAMACNGLWMSIVSTPMAGTVTAITGTVA